MFRLDARYFHCTSTKKPFCNVDAECYCGSPEGRKGQKFKVVSSLLGDSQLCWYQLSFLLQHPSPHPSAGISCGHLSWGRLPTHHCLKQGRALLTGVGCPLAGRVSVGKRSPGSRFPLCKVGMSFKWEAKEKHIFGNPHLLALPTRSLWFVVWEVSSLAVLLDASPTTGILKLTLSCTSSARGLPRTP